MIIGKLVVKTGSSCTLRCAKCGEFNPYIKDKKRSYNVEMPQLIEDVKKIITAAEQIALIDIAGGEALLHKDLHVLIDTLADEDKVKAIHIVSNGTVMPDERIIESLQRHKDKAELHISDYSAAGINNADTIRALQESGINYHVIKDMEWLDKSDTSYKNYSQPQLEEIADNCATYRTVPYFTLINGILSAHCPTAGSLMYYLDLYDDCKSEYINIRDKEELSVESLEALNKNKILSGCNYCVPSYAAAKCKAGEQIKDEL